MSTPVSWDEVRHVPEAYRLLSLFRSINPMLGGRGPETLYWELSWLERFVPVDMGLNASTRAQVRMGGVIDVRLACGTAPGAIGTRFWIEAVPDAVYRALLDDEIQRAP